MNVMHFIRKNVFSISQNEMARIAGVTQATVSRWEDGQFEPDRKQLSRIRSEAVRLRKDWDDALFFSPTSQENTQTHGDEAA